jgi:hypothetical protein
MQFKHKNPVNIAYFVSEYANNTDMNNRLYGIFLALFLSLATVLIFFYQVIKAPNDTWFADSATV